MHQNPSHHPQLNINYLSSSIKRASNLDDPTGADCKWFQKVNMQLNSIVGKSTPSWTIHNVCHRCLFTILIFLVPSSKEDSDTKCSECTAAQHTCGMRFVCLWSVSQYASAEDPFTGKISARPPAAVRKVTQPEPARALAERATK